MSLSRRRFIQLTAAGAREFHPRSCRRIGPATPVQVCCVFPRGRPKISTKVFRLMPGSPIMGSPSLWILRAQLEFYPERGGRRERWRYEQAIVQAPRLGSRHAHTVLPAERWPRTNGREFLLPNVVADDEVIEDAREDARRRFGWRHRNLRKEADFGSIFELFECGAGQETDLRRGDTKIFAVAPDE